MDTTSATRRAGDGHQLVFIAGLHRSGTSLLFQLLREHPDVSGFRDTGVPEDEGQHLQTVYPPAKDFGGGGHFGFDPDAHLLEAGRDKAESSSAKLFGEWSAHWDLTRRVLIEKSPPNLIRTRYLQSLFPTAKFVTIVRHPVEVVLAQKRRPRSRRQPLREIFDHWFTCHDLFLQDAPHIDQLLAIRYEDLVAQPEATLRAVLAFIGLDDAGTMATADVSDAASSRYRQQWLKLARSPLTRFRTGAIVREFGGAAERYGYAIGPPWLTGSWGLRS